jgi:hypothetical protein
MPFSANLRTLIATKLSDPFSASGGTETTSGSYTYHTYNSSGTFTVTGSGVIDLLCVAGGGAGGSTYTGGWNATAGGGAGGMRSLMDYAIYSGTHTAVIGAGGTSAYDGNATGLTAVGSSNNAANKGGAGAYHNEGGDGYQGRNGGSGGGGANARGGGTGIAGQGNNGYHTSDGNSSYSGAGGGKGGTGGQQTGGAGLVDSNFSGTTFARGGDGAPQGGGQSGGVNTGSGGYGKPQQGQPPWYIGGNGGSGIIIIRYLTSQIGT